VIIRWPDRGTDRIMCARGGYHTSDTASSSTRSEDPSEAAYAAFYADRDGPPSDAHQRPPAGAGGASWRAGPGGCGRR
jgi:hypothetical protein